MRLSKLILYISIGASLALHLFLFFSMRFESVKLAEKNHRALVEIGYVEVVRHAESVALSALPRATHGKSEIKTAAAADAGSGPVQEASAPPGVSDLERARALSQYIADVRERINRAKVYPPEASEREQEGTVTIGISLDRAGRILKYLLESPSPYRALNEAAERAVRGTQFTAFPRDLEGDDLHLHIPVSFVIHH